MEKRLTLLFSALALGLGACASNGEETGNYDPADYNYTMMNTSGEETDIFQEDENALYLYFTGTN